MSAADSSAQENRFVPEDRKQPPAAGCPGEPVGFYPCAIAKAKTFNPPRTADGVPDLQGIWSTAREGFDLEDHRGSYAIIGETTVIVDPPDGRIPYQPWAAARKKDYSDKHLDPPSIEYVDPSARCLLRGAPRQTYMPQPFEIFQTPGYVVTLTELGHAYRTIPTTPRPHISSSVKLWNGDSRGRWDGATLVVETTNQNGKGWLDDQGNFFSEAARVVERYTLIDADVILYEAVIEDPTVFTRPWTMAMPLRRNRAPNFELMEAACHEGNHAVDVELGHLRKKP